MQFKIYKIFLFTFFIFLLIFPNLIFLNTHAAEMMTPLERAEAYQALKESGCPDSVLQPLENMSVSYPKSNYIQGIDENGRNIYLTCNNATAIEKLVVRIFMLVMSIIGSVFSFSLGKSSILMIAMSNDTEKFQEATKSLKTSIGAVVGVFVVYMLMVFILTSVLGLGRAKDSNWNIICGNKIVFDITFGNGTSGCK